VFDETPEGKSIVRLAEKIGAKSRLTAAKPKVSFPPKRMSGTNLPDGGEARKGAVDAIKGFAFAWRKLDS